MFAHSNSSPSDTITSENNRSRLKYERKRANMECFRRETIPLLLIVRNKMAKFNVSFGKPVLKLVVTGCVCVYLSRKILVPKLVLV